MAVITVKRSNELTFQDLYDLARAYINSIKPRDWYPREYSGVIRVRNSADKALYHVTLTKDGMISLRAILIDTERRPEIPVGHRIDISLYADGRVEYHYYTREYLQIYIFEDLVQEPQCKHLFAMDDLLSTTNTVDTFLYDIIRSIYGMLLMKFTYGGFQNE